MLKLRHLTAAIEIPAPFHVRVRTQCGGWRAGVAIAYDEMRDGFVVRVSDGLRAAESCDIRKAN